MVTQVEADVFASGNTTGPLVSLLWPAATAAGDTLVLVALFNGVAGTANTAVGASTGITVPAGFTERTDWGSPHAYSASMAMRVWTKTAVGGEGGTTPGCTWGGGSGGTLSRTYWAAIVVPAGQTIQGITWTDQASLTTASVAAPDVTHTGSDIGVSMGFERGSSPSTAYSATPSGYTVLDTAFGTSTGACSGSVARGPLDRDGTVTGGTWTTNTANSAGRTGATMVVTYARVAKTTATTWNTRARVAKTTATTYDVRTRVAKTTATTFDVRARVAKTTATTWDVAGTLSRISKTQATTWNTRARVAKTTSTTWDVAGPLTRISKTQATTWNVRARVAKTTATTWNTRTRVAKTTATTWNLTSMISEADWPAYIAHRGGDPGPEETLAAYDARWAITSNHWHEGDLQVLSDGTTMVASHDDTIDRMYSSGPVATGNISTMTPTQWDATSLHVNSGFTGADQPAMRLSAWLAKYGGGSTSGPAIGLWECKTGTDITDCTTALAGQQGQVIINCNSLADAQAAVAAGFSACYQTNTPTFSQFTSNGIKYLSINYTSMTGTIATNAIAAGVKVLMYTVNSTANRDSMLALFSDTDYAGFISNKPATIDGTTRIAKTTATTWNVRARVPKTTATTWNTRARVAKAQATTWDTRARVAKTTATTWNAYARVPKTTATTWNTRQRVAKATSTTWDTAGSLSRISKATATTWNTRQRVAKSTATTWDERARLAKTTLTTWDVRARLVKTTPTSWDVRARATKTTSAAWDVLARVAKAQGTTWDVRSRVVKTTSTTWDVAFIAIAPSFPTPERVYRIAAEDRTYVVATEDRTYRIPAEARVLEVALP